MDTQQDWYWYAGSEDSPDTINPVQPPCLGKKLQPHLVTVGLNGKVTCDDCVKYKGLKLCPHALCVAETIGILDKYLDWRQKSKQQVNMD
jgi:hypothetical protein